MSNQFTQFMARFNAMPRAIRWAAYATIVIVLFLVWDTHIRPTSDSMRALADRIESDRELVRNTRALNAQINQLRDVISVVGDVESPRDIELAEQLFEDAVTDTLKEYGVRNESFSFRSGSPFRSEELVRLVGGPQTERLTGELRFEATPEDTIALIADLESRSEIDSLNQVTLTKTSGRRLSVFIVLEAWVRPGGAPRTGRGVS